MSEMEKTYFQRFALPHINKKAENSRKTGFSPFLRKEFFPVCRSGFPETQFRDQITKTASSLCNEQI